ncbi:MAG TPA: KpsF/GutQ family sugar-phosphate isomerase, partial [Candidatus Limnocylindria bacterium]|nr:KpsF/GutQ family sugar-phosphate isomerase [Candidatus Limnocylindria bacterium]
MVVSVGSAAGVSDQAGLVSARRVLELEAKGLQAMAREIDEAFIRALDLIEQMQGRVIVTGMGKSGHVARKLAATLASTGTPARFVHAAEASHGDLGMITGADVVIALSNSGETAELADVLVYVKRFDIPLIAMTGKADSTLARASTVTLLLAPAAEACPMGLAPTTSTTIMLALGDALAVATLERKGFSPSDFQMLHPGGMLGRKLLRVAEIMHRGDSLPLVKADEKMDEALITMTSKSLGCVGVVDGEGRLAGIITDGDLRRHMRSD